MSRLVIVGGTAVIKPIAKIAYSFFENLDGGPTTISEIPAWGFENGKEHGIVSGMVHMLPGLAHPDYACEKLDEKIFVGTAEEIEIIGHSQGGFDAISLAHKYPEKVKNVITIATPHNGTNVAWLARKFVHAPAIKAMSPDSRYIVAHKQRLAELSKMNGPMIHSIFTPWDPLAPFDSACLARIGFEGKNFNDYVVCSEQSRDELISKRALPLSVYPLEDKLEWVGKSSWLGGVICHIGMILQPSVLEMAKSIISYQSQLEYLALSAS